jgi:hypothetical protein
VAGCPACGAGSCPFFAPSDQATRAEKVNKHANPTTIFLCMMAPEFQNKRIYPEKIFTNL